MYRSWANNIIYPNTYYEVKLQSKVIIEEQYVKTTSALL